MSVTKAIQPSPAFPDSLYGTVLQRVVAIAPAPLLPGEKEADYATIAERVVGASGPRDAIEEILIRDVVDLTWEILRVRRIKAGILRATAHDGVNRVLDKVVPFPERGPLSKRWAAGDESARKEVDVILTKAGMTIDDIIADTLGRKLESFERLDRMLASAEARRNNALREIDRHRDALGAAARRSIEEIEDAEFRDVETGEIGAGPRP